MAYKIGEWSQVKDDFRNCFDVSFGPFYDGFMTMGMSNDQDRYCQI